MKDPGDLETQETEQNSRLWIKALVLLIPAFNHGYNISVIDGPKHLFNGGKEQKVIAVSDLMWGGIVSVFCVGAMLGSWLVRWMRPMFSYRDMIIIGNVLYALGGLLVGTAAHSVAIFFGRLLTGLASGIFTTIIPLCLSEIGPDRMRGTLGMLNPVSIVLGLLFATMASLWLATEEAWRYLFWITSGLGLLHIGLILLVRINSRIQENKEEGEEVSVCQLLKMPEARKSLVASCSFHAAQQLSGANAVFYFATTLFESARAAVGFSMLNCVGTISSIWLVERTGRRRLTLLSTFFTLVGAVGMALSFWIGHPRLVLGFAVLFIGAYSPGLGSVPWVIPSDVHPSESVGSASTIAVVVNWLTNAMVGLLTPLLVESHRSAVFVPFAVVLAVFCIYVYFCFPETKGRPAGYL